MGAMKTSPLPRFAWLQTRALWLVLALSVTGLVAPAHALRIKEVASVQGVRSNQLSGYGLVVGLDGTGDQSTQMPFTAQAMANYLQPCKAREGRGLHGTHCGVPPGRQRGEKSVLLPPYCRCSPPVCAGRRGQ